MGNKHDAHMLKSAFIMLSDIPNISRKIDKIIVHCTDSRWGDLIAITDWHTLPYYNKKEDAYYYKGKKYESKSKLPTSVRNKSGRGWINIGYHHLILNEYPTYQSLMDREPVKLNNGKIEIGRPLEEAGAHCTNHNQSSIGICLVGDGDADTFTDIQFDMCSILCLSFCMKFKLNPVVIYPHNRFVDYKNCPEFKVNKKVVDKILYSVKAFQKKYRLTVDGIPGMNTINAIRSNLFTSIHRV